MISEAVLSVERTGLPYLTIMIDDSASQQIADQYERPETAQALQNLARQAQRSRRVRTAASRRDDPDRPPEATRIEIAKGLILKDKARLIQELQKQHRVRLYLVSNSARLLAEVDRPGEIAPGDRQAAAAWRRPGARSRLGDGIRQVLTELRGAPPRPSCCFPTVRPPRANRSPRRPSWPPGRACPFHDRPGQRRAGARPGADRTPGRRHRLRGRRGPVPGQAPGRGFRGPEGDAPAPGARSGQPGPQGRAAARVDRGRGSRRRPAQRVELVHRPKGKGERTFILEIDKQPRELQAENNRIERVVTVRKEKIKVLLVESEPRYEFRYLKNYLEREETIDLGVVLLSSDPEYSEQDRSALPTFPAAKDELFAYDVVIVGDADPGFLSHSQMQNLTEFVTEKGGGILFIAGESFNPLAYRGHAAGDPAAHRAGRRPQPHGRGQRDHLVPSRADRRGAVQPDLPVRRERGRQQPDLAEPARALLVLRGASQEAGGAGPGRAPDRHRQRRESWPWICTSSPGRARPCSTPSTTPGGGGSAPATATSAGSGCRRSASWPAPSWSASARPRSRPTAAATSGVSRSSSGSGSPTRPWPRPERP